MSGVEDGGSHRLVAELAATPGAVPALVTLHDGDGRATHETLSRACGGDVGADRAVRWLIDVGLARPSSAGSVDDPSAVYELTDVGRSVTRTLIDLARALSESAVEEP